MKTSDVLRVSGLFAEPSESTWSNQGSTVLTLETLGEAIAQNERRPYEPPVYHVRPAGYRVCKAVAERYPGLDACTLAAIGNTCDTVEEGLAAAAELLTRAR
jgi:hypothetical protein